MMARVVSVPLTVSSHTLVLENLLSELSSDEPDYLLSCQWFQKLLEEWASWQDQFISLVSSENLLGVSTDPIMYKLVSDYFNGMNVAALDICTAIHEGINKTRQWGENLDFAASLHFHRAKKTIIEVVEDMHQDDKKKRKEASSSALRNRSSGQSSSWCMMPSTWSAFKTLESMKVYLVKPTRGQVAAMNGLADAVFNMKFVLFWVMWALVAAIPCQGRSLLIQFSFPRKLPWAITMRKLHQKIMDTTGNRECKNSTGLLKEIRQMDICAGRMLSLMHSTDHFPPSDGQRAAEIGHCEAELHLATESLKNGLDSLELQVRNIFLKIASCRTEFQAMLN